MADNKVISGGTVKEIIVIENRDLVNHYKNSFNSNVKLVSVPETWEELKELCENLEQKVNNLIVRFLPPKTHYDCEVIWFKQYGLWVDSNGFVLFKKYIDEDMIGGSKHRTPAQQWQIIKSLVEE